MSFDSEALSLLALGIRGHQAQDDEPKLPDGIHLRWAIDPAAGFPWHGFYLFRREREPARPRCLGPHLRPLRPGASASPRLATPLGTLSSPGPLRFTEDFAPALQVEAGLEQGLRFDLPAGVEARRVELSLGFREPAATRTCVDFRRFPLGLGVSPRTEKGAVFSTTPQPVSPPIADFLIAAWPGTAAGLQTTRGLEILLPCAATRVELLVSNRGALEIEAQPADGGPPVQRSFDRGALVEGSVIFEGPAFERILLHGGVPELALLHQICWSCPAVAGSTTAIEVRLLAGEIFAGGSVVRGLAGQVVAATLPGSGITAVEIAAGPAALVDLCFLPSRQSVIFGWDEVPLFRYPLCLPVAQEDYACPGKPATAEDARELAFSRVSYPAPAGWDQDFPSLHGELVLLVEKGSFGGRMLDRRHAEIPGVPLATGTQADIPHLGEGLRPLELVLLASLQPAMAQMLGLYFVDTAVTPGVAYDYLLLADPTGALGGSAASALAWLAFAADPALVDADLVTGQRMETRPPIAAPAAPRAYALPGMAVRQIGGQVADAVGNAGLWWPLPPEELEEDPGQPIFYFPKRASLGTTPPLQPPPRAHYLPVALPPLLVSVADPPAIPEPPGKRASDWPQPPIALHAVDANLPEGWYSYRLAAQDIFGRRSPLGPPCGWYQWPPATPGQKPWYYQEPLPGDPPDGHKQIHPFALALLDKIPPPPPLGVEAWALDPEDRWLLVDGPVETWRAEVGDTLVGLRVRWRWTLMQQIQAPDTREFRVYYQAGRWNARVGNTVTVDAVAAKESVVELDFEAAAPPADFAGTRLRVGNDDFAVLGGEPGPGLRLRVKNIGVHDELRPAEDRPCTVVIPEHHRLWVDTGKAPAWSRRLALVAYEKVAEIVVDPSRDGAEQPLTSANPVFGTVVLTLNGNAAQFEPFPPPAPDDPPPPPANPDLRGIQPFLDHLWLQDSAGAEAAYPIVRYDPGACTLEVEGSPSLGPITAWIVGRPAREYDLFLPAPDVGVGNPFEPSLDEPTVYAQVAVSAADDKVHVPDDPQWPADLQSYGNESRLSPSATVFRVLQRKPEPPELPLLPGRLYATPADYRDRSYSTFRFLDPGKPLRVHLLRALDESLFERDWLIRDTRKSLDPVADPEALGAKVQHLDFFPDGWDFAAREAVATHLNELAKAEEFDYAQVSDAGWEVLALLPGNEGAAPADAIQTKQREALEARDRRIRRTRGGLEATDTEYFPQDWNEATRHLVAAELNPIASPDAYQGLSDGALRVLAALPGNETIFGQVTLQPLEMKDGSIADGLRPDDDKLYAPKLELRAYTDELPGRATNRYFYRAKFVDGAQNQSLLSLPGPPVYLHKVEPPRSPVITRAVGADRRITICWTRSSEPGIAEYQVWRTTNPQPLDFREAILVHVRHIGGVGGQPNEEICWTDEGTPGLVVFRFCVISVDMEGNVSRPSEFVAVKAFDLSPPSEPVWGNIEWIKIDALGNEFPWSHGSQALIPAVVLTLHVSESGVKALCQRSESGGWRSVTPWQDPEIDPEDVMMRRYRFVDEQVEAAEQRYRAVLMSRAGVNLQSMQILISTPPEV